MVVYSITISVAFDAIQLSVYQQHPKKKISSGLQLVFSIKAAVVTSLFGSVPKSVCHFISL